MTNINYDEITKYMIAGTKLLNNHPKKAKAQIDYLMKSYKSATMKKMRHATGLPERCIRNFKKYMKENQ